MCNVGVSPRPGFEPTVLEVFNNAVGGPRSASGQNSAYPNTPAWKFLVILKILISWFRCV